MYFDDIWIVTIPQMKKFQQTGFWKATPLVTLTNLNRFGWVQNQGWPRWCVKPCRGKSCVVILRKYRSSSIWWDLLRFIGRVLQIQSQQKGALFCQGERNKKLKALFKISWLNFFLSVIFSAETGSCKSAGKGRRKFSQRDQILHRWRYFNEKQ